jgi:hypothetical protein
MDNATLSDQIRALEEQLLEPTMRKSRSALETLLADDFVEFASDGRVYDKNQVVSALQRELPLRRSISDFAIRLLSTEIVLATYKASRENQETAAIVQSLRSSVWRRTGDGWQLVFHQGTICPLRQAFG